jgi:hypothetical protein
VKGKTSIQNSKKNIDKEEDLSITRIPVQRRKVKTKSTGTKLKKPIDTGTYRYKDKISQPKD